MSGPAAAKRPDDRHAGRARTVAGRPLAAAQWPPRGNADDGAPRVGRHAADRTAARGIRLIRLTAAAGRRDFPYRAATTHDHALSRDARPRPRRASFRDDHAPYARMRRPRPRRRPRAGIAM
ncbi:hypothetical protein WS64_04310 [Burkholderia anthina]|uniref:Uncharacterized protein n=1 Tax=Burkholderia anthina TaxID=179879 RepID=A0AAW3PZE5_9BURK|nr:hypothetical protein WS64_04310 [Burkholderia anthina]